MTKVIKRSGKRQAFNENKIRKSIEHAAKDAKISGKNKRKIMEEVAEPVISLAKKKRVVKAINLRKAILTRLDRKMKSVANAWRRYERRKKR